MTGPRITEPYKEVGMINLGTDELAEISEGTQDEITVSHVTEAIQRGVTPQRLEFAYRKNNVTILAGDCRVYRNMLKALASRWGIERKNEVRHDS